MTLNITLTIKRLPPYYSLQCFKIYINQKHSRFAIIYFIKRDRFQMLNDINLHLKTNKLNGNFPLKFMFENAHATQNTHISMPLLCLSI